MPADEDMVTAVGQTLYGWGWGRGWGQALKQELWCILLTTRGAFFSLQPPPKAVPETSNLRDIDDVVIVNQQANPQTDKMKPN